MKNKKWTFQKYVGRASYNNLQIALHIDDTKENIKLIKEDTKNSRFTESYFLTYKEYVSLIDESDKKMESGLQFLISLLNRFFYCEI